MSHSLETLTLRHLHSWETPSVGVSPPKKLALLLAGTEMARWQRLFIYHNWFLIIVSRMFPKEGELLWFLFTVWFWLPWCLPGTSDSRSVGKWWGRMNVRMPQSFLPNPFRWFCPSPVSLTKKKKRHFNKNIDFLAPRGFLVLVCYK